VRNRSNGLSVKADVGKILDGGYWGLGLNLMSSTRKVPIIEGLYSFALLHYRGAGLSHFGVNYPALYTA
jgi:hypothetical protein